MKKVGIGIAIVIIIVAVCVGIYYMLNSNKEENVDNTLLSNNKNKVEKENIATEDNENKILVVYFSAQSHTKSVAEKIADKLNADIFEIVPIDKYTSDDLDWNDENSRVSKEHNDESLRNVKLKKTKVDNLQDYDTILIGYPIWWGNAAWPVNTFVKANDFNGKTVIPFCTSSSSGLGQSGKLLEEKAKSGNWLEGMRFTSNPLDSVIKTWTDSIK